MGTGALGEAGRELDFQPFIGERWEVTKSTDDTAGELFEATIWLDPQMPAPPPHVHPNAEESLEVLEGSLDFFEDGAWSTLRPGETITVLPDLAHTLRNASNEPAKIVGRFRPAGRAATFFRHMDTLIGEGKLKGLTHPRSGIYVAMVFSEYPDVSRVTGPQSAVLKALAYVGKALRFKL